MLALEAPFLLLRFGRLEREKPLQKALGGRRLLRIPGFGAGHADLTTTMRYMHLSPSSRREAIRLLDRRPNHVEKTAEQPAAEPTNLAQIGSGRGDIVETAPQPEAVRL